MPRRPNIYVVARFLDALHRDRKYTRNQLQMAVRLNYDLYRSYLSFMQQQGYIEWVVADGQEPVARVTSAGSEAYQRIVDLLREWLSVQKY